MGVGYKGRHCKRRALAADLVGPVVILKTAARCNLDCLVSNAAIAHAGGRRGGVHLGPGGRRQAERYCPKTEVESVMLWTVVVRSMVVIVFRPGPE